jgi:D-ribose pyranase
MGAILMKKQGIINSHISQVLSTFGHTDTITIADCGLPIYDEAKRIDLSLKLGVPSFLDVLDSIRDDVVVEEITIANEIKDNNHDIHHAIIERFASVKINYVSHEEFKKLTIKSKAVVRTGEATPYANIILHAGVLF